MKFILTVLLGLCLMGLSWSNNAFAQSNDAIGLSINPAIIEQPLQPGISTTISIQVTNISNRVLPVAVGTRPLVPVDPLVDNNLRQRYDASQWLTPIESNLLLEPGESTSVQLVARPDDEAGVGGHYALVVFRVLSDADTSGSSTAQVNPEVTSVVLFSLPGEVVELAELIPTQPPVWQFSLPDDAQFNLVNRGNLHFLPHSTIIFKPVIGGQSVTIEPGPHLVLPGTSSVFAQDWPDLDWGLYEMEIMTSYGTPIKSLESSTRWFFVPPPVWIQLVTVVSVVIISRFTWRFVKAHPWWRRPRKIGSDTTKVGDKVRGEELDYLSQEPGVHDVSKKRGARRR